MTYNIHPIIVHFPIALLFLYSIIKIIPFAKWWPNVAWRHIERALLLVGVLGAGAALLTGPIARDLVQPNPELVNAHSTFAYFTALVYSLLAIGEAFAILKLKENIFSKGFLPKFLAFVGLLALTVTGMLGGAMVYGTSADPMLPIVLKMLGISL